MPTVKQLRAQCLAQGLATTGKKAELEARLGLAPTRAPIDAGAIYGLCGCGLLIITATLGFMAAGGWSAGWYEAIVAFYGGCESHGTPFPIVTSYLPWLKFSTMDLFGSWAGCVAYRARLEQLGKRVPWFYGVCACTCLQFGGTTLVGALLGQPPSWALSHNAPRSLLLCYYLVFSWDAPYTLYQSSTAAKLFVAVGAALSSGHAVTSWGADKVITSGPWPEGFGRQHARAKISVFSTLIGGALGASGGGLCAAGLNLLEQPPSFGAFQFASTASLFYYLLTNPHGVLPYGGLGYPEGRLCVGVFSLLASAGPKLCGALGCDVAAFTPPRLVEGALRLVLNLPPTIGGLPKED
mmetsp:Transcript_24067/g.72215  ORF Transcript_24067/g.72215 Transcript_24067/m.72215 type:complete len:353 (-) Transcript_24067:28-1086(-)